MGSRPRWEHRAMCVHTRTVKGVQHTYTYTQGSCLAKKIWRSKCNKVWRSRCDAQANVHKPGGCKRNAANSKHTYGHADKCTPSRCRNNGAHSKLIWELKDFNSPLTVRWTSKSHFWGSWRHRPSRSEKRSKSGGRFSHPN